MDTRKKLKNRAIKAMNFLSPGPNGVLIYSFRMDVELDVFRPLHNNPMGRLCGELNKLTASIT